MEKNRENKALYVGIGLIVLVGMATFLRPYLSGNSSESDLSPSPEEMKDVYAYLTPDELQSRIDKKESMRIIDTRGVELFRQEHILGAINADQDTVRSYLEGEPKDRLLVIVGADPNDFNVKIMASALKELDYSNYFILSGGMKAWTDGHNRTIRLGNPGSLSDQAKLLTITPDDLRKLYDERSPFVVLDLRSPQSFAEGHLPGALNFPSAELEGRSREIPIGRQLIYYAQSEIETYQFGVTLFDLGFANSFALEGGISAWRSKGYPIEK